MELGLQGRRALVFGGSKGLGLACGRRLAEAGVEVWLAARTESTLQAAANALRVQTAGKVHAVVADIRLETGRAAALAACPAPDILVTNADGAPPGDFREWNRQDWLNALDAMMLGPIDLIRQCLDPMAARGFGRIINIVSRSVKAPQAELGLSNGARAGLVGFVAGLSRQAIRHHITINNILPGMFATDAQRRHVQALAEREGQDASTLWAQRAAEVPAGRFGDPDEVGALCAFLASLQASYLTGQSILMDGGAYPGTY